MRRRAPRKGTLTKRSPSYDDRQPGRIFSLPFGCWRSQSPDSRTSSASSDFHKPHLPDVNCSDKTTRLVDQRPPIQLARGGDPNVKNLRPSHNCSSLAGPSIFTSTTPSVPSFVTSLADQYLDTMPMDDFWRALCARKIRQKQRKLQALKRTQIIPKKPSPPKPPVRQLARQYKSKHFCRRRTRLPLVSKPKAARKHKSQSSDSGFISSSPPPRTSRFHLRSTEACPGQALMGPTLPVDTSLSIIGRSCLSCNCTNTTCWRRTLGGIICNSCGLR